MFTNYINHVLPISAIKLSEKLSKVLSKMISVSAMICDRELKTTTPLVVNNTNRPK